MLDGKWAKHVDGHHGRGEPRDPLRVRKGFSRLEEPVAVGLKDFPAMGECEAGNHESLSAFCPMSGRYCLPVLLHCQSPLAIVCCMIVSTTTRASRPLRIGVSLLHRASML